MARARAMATRCCWPPDSSPGRWAAWSARPTRDSSSATRSSALGAGRPGATAAGPPTFSAAVQDRDEAEGLEDEADVVPAQREQPVLVEAGEVESVDLDPSGRVASRPPTMFSSVVLPEPERPLRATSSPRGTRRRRRAARAPAAAPLPYDLCTPRRGPWAGDHLAHRAPCRAGRRSPGRRSSVLPGHPRTCPGRAAGVRASPARARARGARPPHRRVDVGGVGRPPCRPPPPRAHGTGPAPRPARSNGRPLADLGDLRPALQPAHAAARTASPPPAGRPRGTIWASFGSFRTIGSRGAIGPSPRTTTVSRKICSSSPAACGCTAP
ncbi:hypothetical protein SGRIM128S_07110 [Streptomyces griseomycini]